MSVQVFHAVPRSVLEACVMMSGFKVELTNKDANKDVPSHSGEHLLAPHSKAPMYGLGLIPLGVSKSGASE